MIIIQLAGGLGNQMFQYALYLQLKSLGKDVKIDDVAGFVEDAKRTPALKPFGADYECPTKKELMQMLDSSPLIWHKMRRRLCGRNKKAYFEEDKHYHPEIMTWDDIYLEGYWQTEKYFAPVADEVRRVFDTDILLRYISQSNRVDDVNKLLERIVSTESVSVHIRRGDYLLPENKALFGGICTETYYRNAMERMKRERPNCRFYLFTNDKEWIRQQLDVQTGADTKDTDKVSLDNIEVVDLGEQNDYAEFALMSKCKHNILANSSFGWWASYLNRNTDRTVLVPDRWLNGWDCEDIYRKDMRKVEIQ